MPRPSDARSRLIRASAALFRQRGYDGVGLAEILEASGAPKGSFYHHFPGGKEQLAEETIRYAGEKIARAIDAAMLDAINLNMGIKGLIGDLARWFERSGFQEGCPITSIALAVTPQSQSHTEAVAHAFAHWRRLLMAHARRFGRQDFSDEDAERLLMLVEGAWILARVQRSTGPLLRAAEAFIASLHRGAV